MKEILNYILAICFLIVLAFGSYQLFLISSELQEVKWHIQSLNIKVGNLDK
ncbi:hypothetical protein BN1002_03719 [Bacillus sp. B-jedd]|nr:hypothetical protein BN1002_03719 [Bacillus sp. B-jedd]